MARVQVNLKLDGKMVEEIEDLVRKGYFSSKTEAFTKALQLLIRQYKANELIKRFDEIREGTEKMPNLTEIIAKSHEEEDER